VRFTILLLQFLLPLTLFAVTAMNDPIRFDMDLPDAMSPENPLHITAGRVYTATALTLSRIVSEEPSSGDGSTSTSPARAYIPYWGGYDIRSYYRNQSETARIPYSVDGGFVTVRLKTIRGGTRYLYVAAKKGSDWKVIRIVGETWTKPYGSNDGELLSFYIDGLSTGHLLSNASSDLIPNNNSPTWSIYIFSSLNSGALSDDSVISPTSTDYNNGVYLDLILGNRLPINNPVTLNSARPGDGRVVLEYYTNGTFEYHYKTVVADYYTATTAPQAATTASVGLGTAIIRDTYSPQAGILIANDLPNNHTYNFAVAQMNKFLFVSNFSNSMVVSTEPIEVLLKKQSCFLVTAGFQEENKILDFYRMVRDRYLLTNGFGRNFVDHYYRFSPPLAKFIVDHPLLAWISREFFTLLYFMLSSPIISGIILLAGVFLTVLLALIKSNNPFQKKLYPVK